MRRFSMPPASSVLALLSATGLALATAAILSPSFIPDGLSAHTPSNDVVATTGAPATDDVDRDKVKAIDEFVQLVNGMWVLSDRFNPDGSRHAEPLRGWTRIDISPAKTTSLSTRAMGSIQAEETGVWDKRMGPTGPADTFDRPFFIESNGTWEVMLDPAQPFVAGSGQAHIIVAQMSTVRGTYRPYSGGLMTQLDSRYLLTFKKTATGPDGTVTEIPATLKLLQPITPHEPVTFRGRRLPNAWLNPVDFKGEPIPQKELEASDCAVQEFAVSGTEMHIKWASGARDYWINQPQSATTDAPVSAAPRR